MAEKAPFSYPLASQLHTSSLMNTPQFTQEFLQWVAVAPKCYRELACGTRLEAYQKVEKFDQAHFDSSRLVPAPRPALYVPLGA